ncbi:oxidoreductase [Streptomyces hoynatensis]|uniref:Oxidoreductase n=1 Tax=Streptomyces hoynatensis TaxID=1141874 RepID=A0A3A9Z3Q0_9ACTN|nr:oxidoreductase [Streptomyces hoynatensis]RKN43061.1 oxidoreductase [Streptomyces hoynatensis]
MNPDPRSEPRAPGGGGSPAGDPLAPLTELPGVREAVDAARAAVDRVYGHRVLRRRAPEVAAEAALRGARASAALSGADWALEEVRRRGDFGADEESETVGAALRLNAEAGGLLGVWRVSPARALARLHLVAAGASAGRGAPARGAFAGGAPGSGAPGGAEAVGRPRLAGEPVAEPALAELAGLGAPEPGAAEVAARLEALTGLIVAGTAAPAPVTAAIVHGELLALRPFRSHNALVARAAERIVLVGAGLDPKSVAPAEVGHAELGRTAYLRALAGYAQGTREGVGAWIVHCARAVELGARESTAVCEALQRGA